MEAGRGSLGPWMFCACLWHFNQKDRVWKCLTEGDIWSRSHMSQFFDVNVEITSSQNASEKSWMAVYMVG